MTEIVKQFYEQTPFPNYDDLDNHRALLEKARSGLFARLLNEQIPYARVVEIGCGTGQLTNFLPLRTVACSVWTCVSTPCNWRSGSRRSTAWSGPHLPR